MKNKGMKSSDIRRAFIEYFTEKNHQFVESSSLIPGHDPTLLFTNAGMVPFKDVFLGLETRPYTRAVSCQRCVRAGGKHNDLENVGYTARHHTFFEMLGNFSFGDYFKREAIHYAWEFLTLILKLPPERLWVTVYQDDDEAADIWLNDIKVSPKRFSRCGEKDNFWSMGDTGPCGPCTEIFYDHGPNIAGGPPGTPEEDGDRYVEIWNLVFMQYNRDKAGHLHPLPKPSVDTGMGLERLSAVVQGVHSNYDIDSFQTLIHAISSLKPDIDRQSPSLKVIADHIRACSFLIVDGIVPGNEGRAYVLRRIVRRAIRHGAKLDLPSPFFCRLVQPLIESMGNAYPELIHKQDHIERVLQQEEQQFSRTLEQGLHVLHEQIKQLKDKQIPGDMAFKLYDTYGFPVDLTEDIADELGLSVDLDGFEQCMQQQRALSQASSQFAADYSGTIQVDATSVFHGYETTQVPATIMAILENNEHVDSLSGHNEAAIILDNTSFYAESGGQVGDHGEIVSNEAVFEVSDTQKVCNSIVHYGKLKTGKLRLGQKVDAYVDATRRQAIRLNHTATHLLHAALSVVLGAHVQQKGSLVDAERARFDFSHFEALTPNQLNALEGLVNHQIRVNEPVLTDLMDIDDAKKSGAMALFGEKYGDVVRVLSIGDFSKELCGGTHALRTGDIGLFKIVAEYGIASGVRRIEFVTGQYALDWVNQQLTTLAVVATKLKTSVSHIPEKLSQFLHDAKQQEKESARLQTALTAKASENLLSDVEVLKNVNVLIKQLDEKDVSALRATLDQLKSSLDNAVIVLFAIHKGKINVVAGISKAILPNVPKAPMLVKHLCGQGGGREDMAQGGGRAPEDIKDKILQIKTMILEHAG